MIKRQLERYGRWLIAIGVLAVLAGGAAFYILSNQRLRTPFQDRYAVRFEFQTSSGLNPGLGQPVNVAGVRVGTITDATLVNGRSIVTTEIDPKKLPRVYGNAHAALVPNTPLKDMQVEIQPGGPPSDPLADAALVPLAQTTPAIDSDEFLAALDTDTRAFFEAIVSGVGRGTRGRAQDLHDLIEALGPTASDVHRVGSVLTARRRQLRRLVHNLSVLASAVGSEDEHVGQVVRNASATLQAIASQDQPLDAALRRLPGTLGQARRSLATATGFANELGPTLDALEPTVSKLPRAISAAGPLMAETEPFLRTKLRPLVRALKPVARNLSPATKDLSAVTPTLHSALLVVTYLVNELAYNPPGDNEGFLHWTAWFAHNGASFLSTQDANGAAWRGLALVSCTTLTQQPGLAPLLELITGPLDC